MVKAIVAGAGGKMGGRVISIIEGTEGIKLAGALEKGGHPLVGRDVGECLGLGTLDVPIVDDLGSVIDSGDVVIDFTHFEASLDHMRIAAVHGKAIVVGSTGFTAEAMEKARELAKLTKCVLAPNMSVGVNVMFKVLDYVAGILGDDFDVEIVEAHHNQKKDAPSGTAVKMGQILAKVWAATSKKSEFTGARE